MKLRKVPGKNGRIKLQDVRTGRFMGELGKGRKAIGVPLLEKHNKNLLRKNILTARIEKSYKKFVNSSTTAHIVEKMSTILDMPPEVVKASYLDLLLENENVPAPEVTDDEIDLYTDQLWENYPNSRETIAMLRIPTDTQHFDALVQLERRCIQQMLILETPNIVKLDNPSFQAEKYVLDEKGQPTEVIYASYGSNLYSERLNLYITGGELEGTERNYMGCRDKSLPLDNIPLALNGIVHYAGNSSVWRGGVAFLDTTMQGKAFGRGSLIKKEQFDDIIAQENRRTPGDVDIDLAEVIRKGSVDTGGAYGNLVHVGDYQGRPVFTFTSGFTVNDAKKGNMTITPEGHIEPIRERKRVRNRQWKKRIKEKIKAEKEKRNTEYERIDWDIYYNEPTKAYYNMIAGGLQETFPSLSRSDIKKYFDGAL